MRDRRFQAIREQFSHRLGPEPEKRGMKTTREPTGDSGHRGREGSSKETIKSRENKNKGSAGVHRRPGYPNVELQLPPVELIFPDKRDRYIKSAFHRQLDVTPARCQFRRITRSPRGDGAAGSASEIYTLAVHCLSSVLHYGGRSHPCYF